MYIKRTERHNKRQEFEATDGDARKVMTFSSSIIVNKFQVFLSILF
jgi:hypothetical protein